MSMMGGIIAGGIGSILDFLANERGNQKREQLGREGADVIGEFASGISPERFREEYGIPRIRMGGREYGAPGTENAPLIDVDEMFATDEDLATTFKQAWGSGYDYTGAARNVRNILGRAGGDPNATASRIMSMLTDLDLSEGLAGQTMDIGRASAARGQQATSNLVSAALRSGRSLSDVAPSLEGIEYSEQQARGVQTQQARAAAEQAQNQNRQLRAQIGAKAFGDQQAINAALAQAAAKATADMSIEEGRASQEYAKGVTAAAESGLGFRDRDQDQAFSALMTILSANQGAAQDSLLMGADLAKARGSMIAGVPVETFSPSQSFSNMGQAWASFREPKQKGGSSFSFFFIGGGKTCVDGEAIVETQNGPRHLRDVRMGDRVRGVDGRLYDVVAMDFGEDVSGEEMVTIATAATEIRITKSHRLQGKAAGDWKVGDIVVVYNVPQKVVAITKQPFRAAGDLLLEGNLPYWANGFVVESMIGKIGLKRWRHHLTNGESAAGKPVYRRGWVFANQNESVFARL